MKYWSRNAIGGDFDDGAMDGGAYGVGGANVAADDAPCLPVFEGTDAGQAPAQHIGNGSTKAVLVVRLALLVLLCYVLCKLL